jgi:hypothetical protein
MILRSAPQREQSVSRLHISLFILKLSLSIAPIRWAFDDNIEFHHAKRWFVNRLTG